MKKFKSILSVLLCLLTVCASATIFASCGKESPVLLSHGDVTLSQAQYAFLLTRAKAAYEKSGYKDAWDTKLDLTGITRDEYVRQQVLQEAKLMLAGVALFHEMKLTLPSATVDAVEQEIDELIEYHGDGSKSELNSILSAYGFNVDMLREQYMFEAKYEYVQTELYGEDGSKLAASAKQEYLNEFAVCFKQLVIRSYRYDYEVDNNGDEIYYLTNANDAKVNKVAYDSVKGVIRTDEFGETIQDKNGDTVYYLPNGKIAYDKENGVRMIKMNADGSPATVNLSREELLENRDIAESMVASVEAGDFAAFEASVAEYADSGDDKFMGDDALCFLYTTGDNGYDSLNDIADQLAEASVGDVFFINTDTGYHVFMKYDIPENAVTNTEYSDWFTDLPERVTQYLFRQKCNPYLDKIVVDNEVFAACPKVVDVTSNSNY